MYRDIGESDFFASLPGLINGSEVIVIGEVGPVLGYDYHRKYQLADFAPATLADYGCDGYVYGFREVYLQIIVEEELKGTPIEPMKLMRPDVEFFEDIDIAPLSTGERIVLFTILSPNPEKFTNKYKAFYDSGGDNSVFDIDEMDRAFPRTPHMFAPVSQRFLATST